MAGVRVTIMNKADIPNEEGYKLLGIFERNDIKLCVVKKDSDGNFKVSNFETMKGWLKVPQGLTRNQQELGMNGDPAIASIFDLEMPIIEDKNKIIEEKVLSFTEKNPSMGQVKVSAELAKLGITVGHMSVRNIWLKHGLETKAKREASFIKHANL